jgi:glycosyltransferase involved in cell wall biosynthesis
MKIAFAMPMSAESPSGLRYFGLAKALAQRGHKVTLLALHHDLKHETPRHLEQGGVQIRYTGQMLVRKVGSQKLYYSTSALLRVATISTYRMFFEAARLKYDLIHLGKPQPVNGLAGLLGGRLWRGRPMYVDCDDYEAESNRFTSDWQRQVVTLFENGLPRLAKGLTVNTHFSQDRYIRLGIGPERIAYIPNGVDRERFTAPPPKQLASLRHRWELEGRQVIGYVGSMSLANHAVDLLLKSFCHLQTQHPAVVLLLVGGGEDLEKLQAQASALGLEDDVRFVGRVPPQGVPAYLALADVTVDPVHDDLVARARSPLKIVESLAMGTPVVTGDVGDRREMLAGGAAGVLVAPGDAQALARGLAHILSNKDVAEALSREALAQREYYYWDRLVKRLIQLYEKGASRP